MLASTHITANRAGTAAPVCLARNRVLAQAKASQSACADLAKRKSHFELVPDSPRTIGVALRAIAFWTAAQRRGDDATCLEVRVGGDRKENRCIAFHLQHSAFAHITLRISPFPETKTKFRGKTKKKKKSTCGGCVHRIQSQLVRGNRSVGRIEVRSSTSL